MFMVRQVIICEDCFFSAKWSVECCFSLFLCTSVCQINGAINNSHSCFFSMEELVSVELYVVCIFN